MLFKTSNTRKAHNAIFKVHLKKTWNDFIEQVLSAPVLSYADLPGRGAPIERANGPYVRKELPPGSWWQFVNF